MMRLSRRLVSDDRGGAIAEFMLGLVPLVFALALIFEFGRAYQTWQVLTNAAREAASVAVLPGGSLGVAKARAEAYMGSGA